MKSKRNCLVATICLLWVFQLAAAESLPPSAPTTRQQAFDNFTQQLAADWMRVNPVAATQAQFFSGAEQDALDRQLAPMDYFYGIPLLHDARRMYAARARAGLTRLKRFPLSDLTPEQRVSAASLNWQLKTAIAIEAAEDSRFVFEQFDGLQISLVNFLSQTHPIRNARDVENYLARLGQVAGILDAGVTEAKRRAELGTVPPGFILRATIEGIDRFTAGDPGSNVLVVSLAERSAGIAGISDSQRAIARSSAEVLVRDQIVPAFQRVRAVLTQQLSLATEDAGLWHQPHGAAAYVTLLRSNTTTDLNPVQVHELGLREVARIEGEMDALLRELGYSEGSVQARFQALQTSVQPPADPDPRPALMAEHERILRDAEQRTRALFALRPAAAVRALREPPFTERGAAAHYSPAAPDGSRPATVWFPLPGPTFDILGMRSLTYHEGVPGHHLQIGLQRELSLPDFRSKGAFIRLNAFVEGWALYAEKLAAESGWYEGDPKGHLGQLSQELFRARRLVADTGIHTMRWTRQQAIDYGIPEAEVDRYAVRAGQACAYKIGELEILAQRDKARRMLGSKYSQQDFHDWVLRTGAVPLPVLGQVIDDRIAAAR